MQARMEPLADTFPRAQLDSPPLTNAIVKMETSRRLYPKVFDSCYAHGRQHAA